MKTLYRLRVPTNSNYLLDEYIEVPATADGMKLATWWSTATKDQRIAVAEQGVEHWHKVAAETTTTESHDLKGILKKLEQEKGEKDTCDSQP